MHGLPEVYGLVRVREAHNSQKSCSYKIVSEASVNRVPQGSVLGPVLFLLYINDMAEGICSHIKLFADDYLIYRTIQSSSDQHILQQDLNALAKWAEKWQMKFNTAKCKIMQMTNRHNKLLFTYKMYDSPLVTTEQHSYLGV